MDHLGPFERPPRLAAAVSGGSDSTALAWLLVDWIGAKGGQLTILTINHGLRPEAAADCAFVAQTFASRAGVSVETLCWIGARPATGIQAAARGARYRLLADRCRELGIIHLFTGHTLDDQAETLAMREAHASTPIGLAAMAVCRPLAGTRLLRPLLGARRANLSDWLGHSGRAWREDPSNLAPRFERVRHRLAITPAGSAEALAARAAEFGRRRDRLEREAAMLLASSTRFDPAGYAEIDARPWGGLAPELTLLALAGVLRLVGGGLYPPNPKALDRIAPLLAGKAPGRTLGGCVVFRRRDHILVCREAGGAKGIVEGRGDWSGDWDGRFVMWVKGVAGDWRVRALGEDGLEQLSRRHGMGFKRHVLPLPARRALPALWRAGEVIAVPHLGWGKGLESRFWPAQGATSCGFVVVDARTRTI